MVATLSMALVTSLVLTSIQPAASEPLPEDLGVSIEPHRLELEPLESAVVLVTILNSGNETYHVLVRVSHVDAPGSTHSTVEPAYHEVSPQTSGTSRVTVTSYAHRGQDSDISDMEIRVYWSRQDDPRMDMNDTQEGSYSFEYEVVDEFDPYPFWVPSAIAFAIIVVAFGLLLVRRRGERPGEKGWDATPGEKH